MNSGDKKVLAIASFGGHWIQLNRLSPFFEKYNTRFITTERSVQKKRPDVRIVQDANRNTKLSIVVCSFQIFWQILIFRPHMIVSTGALPGVISLSLGRIMGCKTVWIDSIANGDELSMSGKLAGKVANQWLTQWPNLVTEEGPVYKGRVL